MIPSTFKVVSRTSAPPYLPAEDLIYPRKVREEHELLRWAGRSRCDRGSRKPFPELLSVWRKGGIEWLPQHWAGNRAGRKREAWVISALPTA